ncbi:MAG: DUF2341 domain-containing protein, partial [Lentisphaerae bacterium]|nr:DUF2341 domain-containing protein [Lentisphaerota bacterium]
MFRGKSGVQLPVPSAAGVWASSYKSVWHMHNNAIDASGNGNHATNHNATSVTGLIGSGYDFVKADEAYIDTPATLSGFGITSAFTLSCWFKTRLTSGQMLMEDGTAHDVDGIYLGISGANSCWARVNASAKVNNDTIAVGTIGSDWHHIALVYNGVTGKMYFDGEEKWTANVSGTLQEGKVRLQIGCRPDGSSSFFDGVLDEARLSSVGRSAAWIWASWKNQGFSDEFLSYGLPLDQASPDINNDEGASNVTAVSAALNGTLVSTGRYATAVTVYWGTTDEGDNASAWDDHYTWIASQQEGRFTHVATDLTPDTQYYYRFKAENQAGIYWATHTATFATGDVWLEHISDAVSNMGTPGLVKVHRSAGAVGHELTVHYEVGGTAVPDQEYLTLSGSIVMPVGVSSVEIEVVPIPSASFTGNETVEITLDVGKYVVGSPATATVLFKGEAFDTWTWRLPITFSGYTPPGGGVGEPLKDFPVLVVLGRSSIGSSFDYVTFLSPPYGDLRFTAEDGKTPLNFEVEEWDDIGESYVWVRVPELTASTKIYAYWGKENVIAPPCTTNGSVWVNSFLGAWHLNGNANDSSPRGIHATPANVTKTDGIIGNAYAFNGSNGAVNMPATSRNLGIRNSFSLSCWFQTTAATAQILMHDGYNGYSDLYLGIVFGIANASNLTLRLNTDVWDVFDTTLINVGAFGTGWHHAAFVNDGGKLTLYYDGEVKWEGVNPGEVKAGYTGLSLGKIGNGSARFLKGAMDEARICFVGRSHDWIWACYQNQGMNMAFNSYGVPERQRIPRISNGAGAKSVTSDSAMIHGKLKAAGTAATTVTLFWGIADGGTSASGWPNSHAWDPQVSAGPLSFQIAGLASDTTYYYRFRAVNSWGTAWSEATDAFVTDAIWLGKESDAFEEG